MRKPTLRVLFLSTALVIAGAAGAKSRAADALTEPQVRALLTEKGYTRIDDLDFEDGAWETDATSADGNRVDVRVDPASGRIFAESVVSDPQRRRRQGQAERRGLLEGPRRGLRRRCLEGRGRTCRWQ